MTTPLLIASLAEVAAGLLVLWWAKASRAGTLPRNWLLGYRTPLTLRNDEAWIAVNRAAAPFLAIAGAGMLVGAAAGVALALFGVLPPVPVVVAAAIAWLLLWLVAAVAPASRAARRYRQRHPTT